MPYNQEKALLKEMGKMLKGQAKTDYQREYMRKRRLLDLPVRPDVQSREWDSTDGYEDGKVYVFVDADGYPIYEE